MSEKIQSVLKTLADKGSVEIDSSVKVVAAYRVQMDLFVHGARVLKEEGFRLVAEWASDETPFGRGFAVFAAYASGGDYLIIKTEIPPEEPSFRSLTKYFPAAWRFERQI